MALLQILLLLLYALPSLLLPITSNPLGLEDTPDNLAWAAQSLESRPEHEGVRKIPKSIFILPNHHELQVTCQDGYKMQDGKCLKAQNFDVNPLALITSQFQQFLDQDPTTVDFEEDYDYDNYDSTESKPYRIQLDLSAANDPPSPVRDGVNDGIQNQPFLADNTDDRQQEEPKPKPVPTSTESENVVPITATIGSNVDKWTDDSLANNKDSTRTGQDVKTTTPSDIVVTTPDESLLVFSDGMSVSTTQKKVLVDADAHIPENAFLEKEEENILSTEKEPNPTTTTIIDNESSASIILSDRKESEKIHIDEANTGDHHHMVNNHIESTTPADDQKSLDKELQSESLFQDDSSMRTPINVSDGTTEISENDIEATTEPLNSLNDKEVNKAISIFTPKASNKTKNPIVVVPTVEQVQIVTPVQVTTTSHSTTHHRKQSNSQSIPSSTTSAYNSELQTAERLDINDSMLNKKMRESVMKHELNEDAIDTIDTNNRFVYTHLDSPHLDSSSNEPEPSTSTTMQPFITQRSLFDQLRFVNHFTEDNRKNNRIRFPEPSAGNIFSNFKGGTIKFPGPVQQRTSEPLFNRLIPDIIPKKPPESAAERPLFSWLPAGTSFDFGRNSSPAFMRFWNKMPLIRDPSMASNDSPEQPRSNSKSPTDNLYKDAPASEVYKVISSKNYKHDNR